MPGRAARPGVRAPAAAWVPSGPPAGFAVPRGAERFPGRRGDGVPGVLSRAGLGVRAAPEVGRFSWGGRVREVEEGPGGALRVPKDGPGGRRGCGSIPA